MDLNLYSNTNEKVKQSLRSPIHEENSTVTTDDVQKRPVGYVSIVSLSSTIPTESTDPSAPARPKLGLSTKRIHHRTGELG